MQDLMGWIMGLVPVILLVVLWLWFAKAARQTNELERKVDRSLGLEEQQVEELREIKALLKKLAEK